VCAFNSSGEIVHQTFEVRIEGGEKGNGDGIAGVAGIETETGKNSNFNAGIATVTAICAINNERTPTDNDDDENGNANVGSFSGNCSDRVPTQ